MFEKRKLLSATKRQGMDETGLKRREIVLRAGFTVEHYECGLSFDNIVLVAARGPLRLRVVRDRGDSFCEARSILHPGAEYWVTYNPRAPFSRIEGLDFDDLLVEVFGESSQPRLSALEAMAEDASRFCRLN